MPSHPQSPTPRSLREGRLHATLPKDIADRLRVEAGDRVLAVETDLGILLTPYDPDAERALRVAANAAKKYRNALQKKRSPSGSVMAQASCKRR